MFGSCCGCGNRKAGRSKALSSTDEEDSSVGEEEVVKKKKAENGEESNGKISSLDVPCESQQLSKDTQDGNLLNDEIPEESAKGCEIDEKANDCDPSVKPSTAAELEALIVRLEKIVDRLERSVSARELAIVNQTLDSVKNQQDIVPEESIERADCYLSKEESLDLDLPPPPTPPPTATATKNFSTLSADLEQRINNLESAVRNGQEEQQEEQQQETEEDDIPTVVHLIAREEGKLGMSVQGYEDIVTGSLAQYVQLSQKIGGDVAAQANLVKEAFDAQLKYVTLATQSAQPPQDQQVRLLQPTSERIAAIQDFREKHRTSTFFNHLSAISESIPALGWVCVAPTPGPHVKEMNDAGQFYTNRVLKEWREKDATHVEWTRAWIQTLTNLQQYIKQHHTTGLVWSGKGAVPSGGCPPPPPPGIPPPPPVIPLGDLSLNNSGDDRSALFAEINRGEDITKNLKKVSADMQTHKNPALRSGPAPFKAPISAPKSAGAPKPTTDVANKAPVFSRDGKKWLIEYQKSNPGLAIDNAEMNNVAYMFRCQDSTLTVKGKINSIVIDSCKKCSILFDSLVSSIEFVNCQSVQMQVLGKVPTISIDKTDGCQMYLSDQSMDVEIISSKSSEMNVLIPKGNGDYAEQPIPEQFKTTIKGKSLNTVCVESLG
ncbi:adenylyl cyclase-associated protein 1 isoform X2 [Lutzomyia longipalpis]|uniref:adenylyl cyclase-associated protein 1 isoform X2 n=1 Tax=Lutzomyia longipalpis TaxID=7200 RepID=UPI0024835CAF|nr:adenylyl cyclase-associated protein 1 isoform X2 [Lutzomyia longipalpis]